MSWERPLLLDLFCCAGGASMGYHRAGFEVVGVDIKPQKNYPFTFYQADALEFAALHGREFDAIHASPPCQFISQMFNPTVGRKNTHLNLIPATRELLQAIGKPYVIENVKAARAHLLNPLKLSGSMFEGLNVFRDRLFEIYPALYFAPATPRRDFMPCPVNSSSKKGNQSAPLAVMKKAMGITWDMDRNGVQQSIPPAYTEFIGRHLLAHLGVSHG